MMPLQLRPSMLAAIVEAIDTPIPGTRGPQG